MISNHDLPPFAQWWQGDDLNQALQLALISAEQKQSLYEQRQNHKSALIERLTQQGQSVSLHSTSADVYRALCRALAQGSSKLLTLQLDDLDGQHAPVNIPGTHREYPNWRRQLSQSAVAILQQQQQFICELTRVVMEHAMIDNTGSRFSDAVCALEEAQVGEPRQLLGHQCIDGSWYVILYKPGALAVEVQFATHTCIAQRYSDSEVFIAPAQAEFVPYQLCVTYPEAVVVQADPFCLPLGLSAADLYYFRQGTEQQAQRHLGAHMMTLQGHRGVRFSVWAPNALAVSVTGDFNHWDSRQHPMARVEDSGVWAIFIPDVAPGQCYKYHIRTLSGEALLKADPYAFATELSPNTASRVSAVTLPKALDEQS